MAEGSKISKRLTAGETKKKFTFVVDGTVNEPVFDIGRDKISKRLIAEGTKNRPEFDRGENQK